MARKRKDPYRTMTCANPACARTLVVSEYIGRPSSSYDPKKIHRIYDPAGAPRSVFCTCGHYTEYVFRQEDATG
jgi:hypothetical protein